MQKEIIWESRHLEIDTLNDRMVEADDERTDWEEENESEYHEFKGPIKRLAMLPFSGGGIVDLDDSLNPLKNFEFWLAHTNFNISKPVAEKILAVPGVEVLRVLTRYRFLIAVGKVFKAQDVKLRIQCELYDQDMIDIKTQVIKDTKVRNSVKSMAKQLDELNVEWSILIFPNGSIDFAVNTEDFKDQYDSLKVEYQECVKDAQCILIDSN